MEYNKKTMGIFFGLAFGLPVVLGVCMGVCYARGADVSLYPNTWMFLPSAGAMVAAFAAHRGDALLPKAFFGFFVGLAAVLTALCLAAPFLPAQAAIALGAAVNLLVIGGSLVCLVLLVATKNQKLRAYGLGLLPHWKMALAGVGLFALLYLLLTGLSLGMGLLLGQDMGAFGFSPYMGVNLAMLPLNLVLSFAAFFGEEYGWRWFLQPALQKKFGMRGGVVLLGLIWGLWHLPINLFFYSPETWVQSVVNQLAACVGYAVFFGWVYLKTRNIWACVAIHFLNNNLGVVLFGASISGNVLTWADTLVTVALYLLVFLPFLLTKEYRQPQPRAEQPLA